MKLTASAFASWQNNLLSKVRSLFPLNLDTCSVHNWQAVSTEHSKHNALSHQIFEKFKLPSLKQTKQDEEKHIQALGFNMVGAILRNPFPGSIDVIIPKLLNDGGLLTKRLSLDWPKANLPCLTYFQLSQPWVLLCDL